METAIAYIRVSDARQVSDGTSLKVQENEVRAYANRFTYELERVFIEEGESAKTDQRPVLQEMLGFLRSRQGKIQVLIVPKLDRFARNVEDWAHLKVLLRARGVRLESAGERIENTPVGRFTEALLASAAQFDNEVRADRCRSGMVQAVKEGRWVWRPPFGYQTVRRKGEKKGGSGTIEPHPVHGRLVQEAFGSIAEGRATLSDVVSSMKSKGYPMTSSGLHKLLRNKVYLGFIEAFDGVYEAKPPFVPLIESTVFYSAQDALRSNRRVPRTYRRDHPGFPLRGTLRCICGAYLTANIVKGHSRFYAHYRCISCQGVNLPRPTVEGAFDQLLATFEPIPERIGAIKQAVRYRWDVMQLNTRDATYKIGKELEELAELEQATSRKTALGIIPDFVAMQQFEDMAIRRAKLETERNQMLAAKGSVSDVVEFAEHFLAEMAQFWRESAVTGKKRLQCFLFPTGLTYTKNGGFRTADYPLLEHVKHLISTPDIPLVDQALECPNEEIIKFFDDLYRVFGKNDDEEEDQDNN